MIDIFDLLTLLGSKSVSCRNYFVKFQIETDFTLRVDVTFCYAKVLINLHKISNFVYRGFNALALSIVAGHRIQKSYVKLSNL